ncbi:hypothetical protein [Halothermothrix orenii]|uniref:Uncharacterized protein n=1 Tax=Halothermothrix orenii (strain H 168 / OCM 544 / DSM 9562) TaxID=373903 RepID=B8CXS4_HALOH|nr:hypothetical protein [Halothermothrix orenii]ACL70093.1 hypothetical protein Hore_13430 [Halothermothrix orenii H 168]
MFLFEYIIKLLMGSSETLFMGLIIIIFGYYGWLLWNINNSFHSFEDRWNKHEENLNDIKNRMKDLDKSVYKELIQKLNTNLIDMKDIDENINKVNDDMKDYRNDIIDEIKESEEEIKEVMKLLITHRSRNYQSLLKGKDSKNNKK